jgi:hypothetical protein
MNVVAFIYCLCLRFVVFKYTVSSIFRQAIPQKHVINTNISDIDSSTVSPRFSGVHTYRVSYVHVKAHWFNKSGTVLMFQAHDV